MFVKSKLLGMKVSFLSFLKLKSIKNNIVNIENTIDNSPTLNPKNDIPTNDLENRNTKIKKENIP